jgi:threonine/homoserine/homoserine lactone efflux protein
VLDAIGEVLPAAAGVALSPFPIIAIVLVLGTSQARANGLAFTLGWVLGLAATTAVMLLVTDGSDDPDSEVSALAAGAKVAVGLALLALAVKKWRSRPRPGEAPTTPAWMASLTDIHPPRAFGLAAALGGLNPKNVAFCFAAASSITALGLDGADAAVAAGTYVVLGSATVLGAFLAHLVAGERAEAALASVQAFMLANNAVIMMVILLVLGAKVLGDGLASL